VDAESNGAAISQARVADYKVLKEEEQLEQEQE
jgi:hypothetical protein